MTDERRKIMDTKYLEEIKARHEAATPGPWELSRDAGIYIDRDEDYCICGIGNEPDAEFIAHSRTDIPALLAEVERLQKAITAVIKGYPNEAFENAALTYEVEQLKTEKATLKKALEIASEQANTLFNKLESFGIISPKTKASCVQDNIDAWIQQAQEHEENNGNN